MNARKWAIPAMLIAFSSCRDGKGIDACNLALALADNQNKVSIANGVWGTVIFTQGNCMPTVGGSNTCSSCPVKRTVQVYAYTTRNDVIDSTPNDRFYDSFNTTLVKEITSDAEGFFEAELAPGTYTIVAAEGGKIYAGGSDGQGGINPVTIGQGKKKLDFRIDYKAAY